jgi:hypothetical protein
VHKKNTIKNASSDGNSKSICTINIEENELDNQNLKMVQSKPKNSSNNNNNINSKKNRVTLPKDDNESELLNKESTHSLSIYNNDQINSSQINPQVSILDHGSNRVGDQDNQSQNFVPSLSTVPIVPSSLQQKQTTITLNYLNSSEHETNTRIFSPRGFIKKLFNRNKLKKTPSIDINDLIKPLPPLPIVKFDDEGDFYKEPLEVKIGDEEVAEKGATNAATGVDASEAGHMIRITNKIVIDTKKVNKFLKKSFKFAFSQIGLAGLVVGYVILGALLFMKIESEYEKENQNKIEKNREDFFENVKISAEQIFNDYLKENFHIKYSKYRNEEILLREEEQARNSILNAAQIFDNSRDHNFSQYEQKYYEKLKKKKKRQVTDDNYQDYVDNQSTTNKNDNNYEEYSSRHSSEFTYSTTTPTIPLVSTTITSSLTKTVNVDSTTTGSVSSLSAKENSEEIVRFDRKSFNQRKRPSWHIELDREQFYKEIKQHLRILLIENDKIEDKEKQALTIREEVWNYPNALLYSATVITTIGKLTYKINKILHSDLILKKTSCPNLDLR